MGGRLPCGFRCPPAAPAGVTSGSRNAESKTHSQRNEGSVEAGLRRTAALGELPHAALMLWLITQVHECGNQFLSLKPRIKVLSSCFGTGNAIAALQFTFCPDTERDRILRRFAACAGF